MLMRLKLKYRSYPVDFKGLAKGGKSGGAYKARTGNSSGATGKKWGKGVVHPIGLSGRTTQRSR